MSREKKKKRTTNRTVTLDIEIWQNEWGDSLVNINIYNNECIKSNASMKKPTNARTRTHNFRFEWGQKKERERKKHNYWKRLKCIQFVGIKWSHKLHIESDYACKNPAIYHIKCVAKWNVYFWEHFYRHLTLILSRAHIWYNAIHGFHSRSHSLSISLPPLSMSVLHFIIYLQFFPLSYYYFVPLLCVRSNV